MSDFAIYSADAAKIQALLQAYRQNTKSEYVLLSHRDGSVIADAGDIDRDSSTLSVLCTASFDSARQIGMMLGEPGFQAISYLGESRSVYISAVGESLLLLQVYPGNRLPKSIDDYSFKLVQLLIDAVPAFTQNNVSHLPR